MEVTTAQIIIEDRKIFGAVVIDVTILESQSGRNERKYEEVSQSSCDRLLLLLDNPIIELDAEDGIKIIEIYQRDK